MKKKLPTIKGIAKQLKVSASTVSRALHDHPSIGLRTKLRVQELAKELNYEPNQAAISFHRGKSFTIGVILPDLSESFFSAAISAIEDVANKNDYTVLLGQSHNEEGREKKIVERMRRHGVDGVIISVAKSTINYAHFEKLKEYNIPTVFFDRIPKLSNINTVTCNLDTGTVDAVRLLLKQGHRIIGMINGPASLVSSKERLGGYIKAYQKHRLTFDPALVVSCDLTKGGAHTATKELLSLKRKVTAIVAFNDYVALDATEYALKQGVKINKELSFVSFANLPISNYAAFPPIASVEQFPYLQGQKATEVLLDVINSEENNHHIHKVVLDTQLVVR